MRIILGFSLIVFLALTAIWRGRVPDHFAFLYGRRPASDWVVPPGSSGPHHLRIYSWEADFEKLKAEMDRELTSLRFERQRRRGFVFWLREAAEEGKPTWQNVTLSQGRISSSKQVEPTKEPGWITVEIVEPSNDNVLDILRYTLDRPPF